MATEKKEKRKKKANGFFAEFKKFLMRGNVLDLAVGVIIGSAFTAIVNALSNNILKPLINWLLAAIFKKDSLTELFTFLKRGYDEAGLLSLENSIYIDWGSFINAIINFFLIALILFIIVKTINKISEANEKSKKNMLLEKEAVKKYRSTGLTKRQAVEKYRADIKKAEEEKAAADKLAAEQAAAEAEAKAMANTKLLEEIRDLLKNK